MEQLQLISAILTPILLIAVGVLAMMVRKLQNVLAAQRVHHDQIINAVEEEGIEGVLTKQARDITRLTHDAEEVYKQLERLEVKTAQSLSRVQVMRFNPFNDAGGNQSFVCALLDEQANGLVISSLHHRSGNRMYAKPVQQGQSTFPLSDEEKEIIQRAIQNAPVQESTQVVAEQTA